MTSDDWLREVRIRASDVLGSRGGEWLNSPSPSLLGRTPTEVVRGAEPLRVLELLEKMEMGWPIS